MYTYPSTDLERPDALLALLGSFWDGTYRGGDVPQALAAALGRTAQQTHRDLQELMAAVNWHNVPVWHRANWTPVTLRESQRNTGERGLLAFGAGARFDAVSPYVYGIPVQQVTHAWPVPAGLVRTPVLSSDIQKPSLTWHDRVDYVLQDGYIRFRTNPFDIEALDKQTVMVAGEPTDRELTLWAFGGDFDRNYVYQQYGYALELQTGSSKAAAQLVAAALDALVFGTIGSSVQSAWSAITGVSLVRETDETVEQIFDEGDRKLVVTDRHVYTYATEATVLVTAGQLVHRGDALTDALVFHDFARGAVPDVVALALGRGFLATGMFEDLMFANKDVPLVVTTDEQGYTRLSFDIKGWPADVVRFFDELHTRGVARGQTLAHLLDLRPVAARDTEPTAASLPATINPVQFLCRNVLRNHAFLVMVRPAACHGGTGLNLAKILRKLMPPQTAMLVLLQLERVEPAIRMEEAGTETEPGYEESGAIYLGMTGGETISPSQVAETVRMQLIGGRCV